MKAVIIDKEIDTDERNYQDSGYSRSEFLKLHGIELDENGVPKGHTLEEFSAELDRRLSEFYGVDFAKITRLVDSGALDMDDVTNELLRTPEFKYKPYTGFIPKSLLKKSKFKSKSGTRMEMAI
jgi:hypothetical protein